MTGAISVLVVIALLLALAGVICYDLAPLLGFDSRAPLPRHAGQTRPATPVAGRRAGPAHSAPPADGPAGAPAVPQAGAPAGAPLGLPGILNPRLYETGEMPGISQEAADEWWWLQ